MSIASAAWLAAFAGSAAGCEACGRSGLAVSGDTPYVRCLAAPAPDLDGRRIGPVKLHLQDRGLALEGLKYPVTIAAFSGPGFASPPGKAELDALRAARPHLVLLLGGVGDTAEIAQATLAALAGLPVPTLILAGGRDTLERIERALDALKHGAERITDITALRSIRIAGDTFVPIAGAFQGRYALDDAACGHSQDDLDELAAELDLPEGSRRWLLAWEAPASSAPHAVAGAEGGIETGSQPLAELAQEIGARGGLFAWPHVQAMRPSAAAGERRAELRAVEPDLRLVVPRLTGPALERSDGSHVPPGFALLQLDAEGLRIVSLPAAP